MTVGHARPSYTEQSDELFTLSIRLIFIIIPLFIASDPRRSVLWHDIVPFRNMSMSVEDAATPRNARPTPDIPENVLEQFSLRGKVVTVNGASDGIGYAVAEAMAEAGADVALYYNSNDAAIAKGSHLAEKHNIKTKAYKVEVSNPERVQQAINDVVADFGRLDVFVANAGMGIAKGILDTSVEEYKKLMAVNGMSFGLTSLPMRS